jgi:death-on-curing protein
VTEPEWLAPEDAIFFHGELVRAFGGATGLRDGKLLESAMHRPRQAFGYGTTDLHALAAAYAHAIVKNHPFVDGNKRVAFVVARVFLGLSGIDLAPPEAEAVVMVVGLAASDVTESDFASWLRKHSK